MELAGALLEGVVDRLTRPDYGHLAQDAEDQDRGLLEAYDAANEPGRGRVGANDAPNDSSDGDRN